MKLTLALLTMSFFVDDHSPDDTAEVAKRIGIKHVIRHEKNKGYGGNQKTLYNKALEIGADIVNHGSPRLSIHPPAYSFNFTHDCQRPLSSSIGLTYLR